MIVIVSHPDDVHATRVMDLLRARGEEVFLLDLSAAPRSASLAVDYSNPTEPTVEWRVGGASVPLGACSAVWWRRPQGCELTEIGDPSAHAFAQNEWHEALSGLWQLLDSARWINEPGRDLRASRKAFQLREAARVGLRIPRTRITSDPGRALEFATAHGVERTVYKAFSALPSAWRETRLLRPTELDRLDDLRYAPMIFQEFVPAKADIRVTMVGSEVFAAAIDSRGASYQVDFRVHLGELPITAVELPPALVDQLRRLMGELQLIYGAIDLRWTPDDEYVFLEVNTAGQFLFIEEATGQPIAAAMAAALASCGPRLT